MRYTLAGLGLVMGWLWVSFLDGPLLFKLHYSVGQAQGVFLLFMFFNALAYLGIALSKQSRMGRYLPGVGAVLMMTAVLLLAVDPQAKIRPAACCCGGIGAAILVCAFGQVSSWYAKREVALYYCLAVVIGSLFYVPVIYLPSSLGLFITAIMPLGAAFWYYRGVPQNYPAAVPMVRVRFPFKLQTVGLIMVYYMVGSMMFKVVGLLPAVESYELFWASNIVYGAASVLVGFIIFYRNSLKLAFLYRPVMGLLGVAFLLLPFLAGSAIIFSFLLFQVGFALFDMYIWMLLKEISDVQERPVQVFGWGFFILTVSMLLASLLYSLVTPFVAHNLGIIDVLSVLAAILMFAAAVIFQSHEHDVNPADPLPAVDEVSACVADIANPVAEAGKDADEPDDSGQDLLPNSIWLENLISEWTVRYGITKREKEVLLLLARGYNNPHMCEQLEISGNTLKTHLRNIYRKMDVNNRQELLRLIHK